jgi:uncharacterized iron-regulated membrane protein
MASTFLRHPQRVFWRKVIFQIHLWTGILLSLYVAIIGVTGALLVFEDEFTALSMPRATAPGISGTLHLDDIIRGAERAAPNSRATFLMFPQPHESFYQIWLEDKAGRQTITTADASSGTLYTGARPWIAWVHDLHIYLLLGMSGLIVNGIGAAILLLLALTGIVLWWPGIVRWTRAIWVRRRGSWRRMNFDLHSAIGFWTLVIVIWWSISGIYFTWPTQVAKLVNAISEIKTMRPPSVPTESATTGSPVPLESIVNAARIASPDGFLSGISLPAPGESYIVYVDRREPGDFSHRDILYFGPASGKLLATWHYGENQSLGDWILWAMHPLHFGTLWGLGPKILWFLLGLSLAGLSVTGLLMYWNRKLRFLLKSR